MTPEVVLRLIPLLENRLRGERNTAIPVHLQVFMTLRFLAEGPFQKGLSQDFQHSVSQTTVSRCINRVIDAIVELADTFIQFPTTHEERHRIQNRYI